MNPPTPARSRKAPRRGIGAAAAMGLVLFGALALLGGAAAVFAVTTFTSMSQGLPDPHGPRGDRAPRSSPSCTTGPARWSSPASATSTARWSRSTSCRRCSWTPRPPWRTAPSGTTAASTPSASPPPASTPSAAARAARPRSPSSSSASGSSTTTATAETQVTASRKIKEIIQSIRVTQAYPGAEGKQKIITAYLNQNYYGNESYGVAAAAKGYFGVALEGPDPVAGRDPRRAAQVAVHVRPHGQRRRGVRGPCRRPGDVRQDAARRPGRHRHRPAPQLRPVPDAGGRRHAAHR